MSRILQWSLVLGLGILLQGSAPGRGADSPTDMEGSRASSRTDVVRDPTAPSSKILERLGATLRNASAAPVGDASRVKAAPAAKIPEIRLKAIVFSDVDHGTAILEVNGRTVTLKLSRPQGSNPAEASTRSPSGFTQGGIYFTVEDFSEDSIKLRLSSDNSVLIVQ